MDPGIGAIPAISQRSLSAKVRKSQYASAGTDICEIWKYPKIGA
jgi:hypothetical protein